MISIPENYYAIIADHNQAIIPNMITCMGICITTYSNKSILVHCADLSGFPSKELSDKKHPLPIKFHAFEESFLIFNFLLQELKIEGHQIKKVSIFGNFLRRDIFPKDLMQNYSELNFKNYIKEQLHISLEKITLLPLKYVDILVDSMGNLTILPDAETRIEEIEATNYKYYKKMRNVSLDKNRMISNFNFFKAANPKRYLRDDTFIEYRINEAPVALLL